MKKKISIGVPCFNESCNIENMYKALTAEMKKNQKYDYEIIFSDNDSVDASDIILRRIAQKDKKVKVILNQSNFGPAKNGINCIRRASGDCYIGIPCDFQEPPEMISEFITEWENGADIVWGQKKSSKENPIKFLCRKIFYKIISFFSDTKQLENVTSFGLMDKKVVDTILPTVMQDSEYYIRNLVCEYNFNIKLIPYVQNQRQYGKSSYNILSYFSFTIISLCITSLKPLYFMIAVGFLFSFFSLFVALFYLIYKLLYWESFFLGVAPVIIGLFFCFGVLLFSIGLLGVYISIIIRRITNKQFIIEKETINF